MPELLGKACISFTACNRNPNVDPVQAARSRTDRRQPRGAQVAQGAAGCAVCLPVGHSGHPEGALLGRVGRGWPGEGCRRVAQGCGGFSHPPAVSTCMPLPPQGQSWALLRHVSGCRGGSVPLQQGACPFISLTCPWGHKLSPINAVVCIPSPGRGCAEPPLLLAVPACCP